MTADARLPRSLRADDGESLAGYLINLSYRLDTTPAGLARLTGLETAHHLAVIDAGFAATLPATVLPRLTATTGLTEDEARSLTLAHHERTLAPGESRNGTRTLHGALWVRPGLTRFCPGCLSSPTFPDAPDRVTWRRDWQLPWSLACPTHRTWLAPACPSCGTTPHGTGTARASLIAWPTVPVTHPSACRAARRAGGPGGSALALCNTRLDQVPTTPAPDAVLALQDRLACAWTGVDAGFCTFGVPVTGPQWLRDLRIAAVLVSLAPTPPTADAIPSTTGPSTLAYLHERRTRRANETADSRMDRTWTHPPEDPVVHAGLLGIAAGLLTTDGLPELQRLIAATTAGTADGTERDRLVWQRVRSTGQPSSALAVHVAPGRNRLTSVHGIRVAGRGRTYNITGANVAAYLDPDMYTRHFPHLSPAAERSVRRAIPLALFRSLDETDLPTAADRLGYPFTSAQAAVVRATRALEDHTTDDLHRHIAEIAAELDDATPIDFGRRRRHFDTAWTIPEAAWAQLQASLLSGGLARRDTPWDTRRPAYTAWVWSLVTQGDPVIAPMVLTKTGDRTTTGGVAPVLNDLHRRATPEHHQLVQRVATDLITQIDAHSVDPLA